MRIATTSTQEALVVRDNDIQGQIEEFRSQHFNVIAPFEITKDRVNDYQQFRLAIVRVNPEENGGDVWYAGSKQVGKTWVKTYVPAKPCLMKFKMAAGVTWDPDRTRRIDDRNNPNIVEFMAVGLYHGPDGMELSLSGTYELDLDAEEEEIRDQQELKVLSDSWKPPPKFAAFFQDKSTEEIVDYLTRRELSQLRRHKVARAETGAKLRALRELGIKSSYTEAELQKPFVFVRLDYAPDRSKPEVRQEAEQRVRQDIADLYGAVPQSSEKTDPSREVRLPSGRVFIDANETEVVQNGPPNGHYKATENEEPKEEEAEPGKPQPEMATKADYSKVAMLASSEHITEAEEEKMLERLEEGNLTKVVTEGFCTKLKALIAERTELERAQAALEI